jgi:transcriptional regulator with XRE-family HTH domain
MKTSRPRPYSRISRQALTLLASQIKLARKELRMTAQELADRAGISRGLVQRIEAGDPGCQIGAVFETAAIVGVKLFGSDGVALGAKIKESDSRLALLPTRIRPEKKVDDAF